nr:hypothetical protein [Peptoniphilus porci]
MEFDKLGPADLRNFIKGYFIRKGKTINNSEVAIFIQESGYNSKNEDVRLLDLNSEMDKIAAVAKDKVIKESDIRSIISDNIDTNIFKFLDAMLSRNTEIAIEEFHNLNKLGEPLPLIFHMIIRQVKNLLSYKILSEKDLSRNDIMNKMDVKKFEFEKKILINERNFSKKFLLEFYDELIKADELFKTSSVDEIVILETIIIKYCNNL